MSLPAARLVRMGMLGTAGLLATALMAPSATAQPTRGAGGDSSDTDRTLSSSTLRATATAASANARISAVLPSRTSNAVLGSRFTMTVWDSAQGNYVFTKRADASLRAASTTKILTTVAALETLGPDHRMPTTVLLGGSGELILKAGGDPLLASSDLRALARATATALRTGTTAPSAIASPSVTPAATPVPTVPVVTGTPLPGVTTSATALATLAASRSGVVAAGTYVVRADDSLFPGSGQSRGWPNSYLPSQVRPVNAFARDDNKARDAAADAGKYFASALRQAGISATYGGESIAPAGAATLAAFAGHTIGQAVSRALLISDNDTAEMLFRQVAVGRGQAADWAGARAAVRTVLSEMGVPLDGVTIIDGSGLSLEGRLTAGALSTALVQALSMSHPRLSGLRAWLPVAGRTGTLNRSAQRYVSKPASCAAGKIQAKTGTVADAIALAGYARGADGNTKVFVAIVNSRPTRYSRLTTRKYVDRAAASITGCW